MISALIKLPRHSKQSLMFVFDVFVITSSLFVAFYLRLGYFYFPVEYERMLISIFISPVIAIPIFFRFGLYREVIRYVSFESIWGIIQAVTLYAVIWGLMAFMLTNWTVFPRSVILINWLLVLITITGSRLFSRWIFLNINNNSLKTKNVLIYGAGSAGRQLSSVLNQSKEYKPVAFIDNDSQIYHQTINGLKIFSQDDLKGLIEKKNISEVLLAIPSISRNERKDIFKYLDPYPVIVRTMPSILDLVQGKATINDLLEIDIKDLLGRESISPKKDLLAVNISKKVVMVTGAGGSIGSELCRQIQILKPKKIVLYEISESSLYLIEQELINASIPDVEILPVIGSISDKARIVTICNNFGIQTIYHAAAYKHVPIVESNQSQGILNNTIGTMIVAEAAIAANVDTFVLISTDKAVRPTSIMGASKRVAELILQALSKQNNSTCFTMVRFGNVLDSSGSVIPLFKKQIKAGGPVTVTHEDVVRYFMTIPEAVELVIQAGALAKGGEVFVLDMGEPIRINDLAIKMIQLSGLQVADENNPKGDIKIQYTGLRPGEKLYEELLISDNFTLTENKLIMRSEEEMISWDKLQPLIAEIKDAALNTDTQKTYKLLTELLPGSSLIINNVKQIKK
jgi:FlaA1/EpsC-like NDP-sugar epimerase